MSEIYTYDRLAGSAFGRLWLAAGPQGLVAVGWDAPLEDFLAELEAVLQRAGRKYSLRHDPQAMRPACQEMSEYLDGTRQDFELPIDWDVLPDFQRQALKATFDIPFGQTCTYADIARQIGHPGAARAVGRAEATNPMPIVLPCHRVVGTDKKLHGYGGPGGLDMKRWLLSLEQGVRQLPLEAAQTQANRAPGS